MRPKERQADGNLEEQQWQKELVRQESQQEIGELKVQVISLQSHPTTSKRKLQLSTGQSRGESIERNHGWGLLFVKARQGTSGVAWALPNNVAVPRSRDGWPWRPDNARTVGCEPLRILEMRQTSPN